MRLRILILPIAGTLTLGLLPSTSSADRRYFLLTYTPYLGPAGESEAEFWLTSKSGKQDPAEGAKLESRVEWEYGITSRLTGAAYLNFVRPAGGPIKFNSPSVEIIYRPADSGRVPLDPAVYLEVTESGDELELEPKLLLAHRFRRWVAATNLIGEFEFRHNDEEHLPSGAVLRNGFTGEITAGLAYGVSQRVALGVEVRGRTEHPNFGKQSAAIFSLGPSLSLAVGKVQLALGLLPQIRGTPRTSGGRNLTDFEKTQVRAVVGVDL